MERYKVRKQEKKRIYAHNDLSNAALHLKNRIEAMEEAGQQEGIALDIMACIAMYAFTFEAKVNFLGAKSIEGWRERQSFHDKLREVCANLGYQIDENARPFKTIIELKSLRDSFAHGKPTEIEVDETVEVSAEDIEPKIDLSHEWEAKLTVDFVRACAEDIELVWRDWLRLAGIELFETITSGEYGVTLIEKYTDTEKIRF